MIKIKDFTHEELTTLLNSDTDFTLDNTDKVGIEVPVRALEITIKKKMYQEDIIDTLEGTLTKEPDCKDGKEPVKKTEIDCKLAIAPDHERKIREYFRVYEETKDKAILLPFIQDTRGHECFTKEQLKFLLEITGGQIVERPVKEEAEETPELQVIEGGKVCFIIPN